ncbi:MAG: hypothetical protein J5969_09595 [Lachnospiraceae bacterium]|nr:hypothetical protein [Lachnospiraceae bacterium]
MNEDLNPNLSEKENTAEKKRYTPLQRALAIIAIALLVGMYLLTLVFALLSSPFADRMFRACLGLTIFVPLAAWITIWAVGVLTHRETIASPKVLNSNPEERRKMEAAAAAMAESSLTSSEDSPGK